MATGFSLGVILFFVMQQLIDNVGWRFSFIFAAFALAVVFLPIGMFVVRNRPSDMGLEVDGEPAPTRARAQRALAGLTVGQALRTPNFWAIALAFMCFFFGMFGWMVNGTPVYESYGISRNTISWLMMGAGLGGAVSRPTFGYLAERIRSVEAASVVLAVFLVGGFLALMLTGGSWLGIGLFIACWLVGSAGGPVLEPLILPRVFGLAHFGAIMGTMFMVEDDRPGHRAVHRRLHLRLNGRLRPVDPALHRRAGRIDGVLHDRALPAEPAHPIAAARGLDGR